MVALPIAKLSSLAIKTLAKPMSKQVKYYFTKSPLSQQFLITIGQTTHNITTRLQIWSAGYKVKNIQPLENDEAVKQGADFIGEFFVFGVAGTLVVWEYDKSKKKEAKKDSKMQQSVVDVKDSLDAKIEKLQDKIDKLEEAIVNMNNIITDNKKVLEQKQEIDDQNTKRRRGWLW